MFGNRLKALVDYSRPLTSVTPKSSRPKLILLDRSQKR